MTEAKPHITDDGYEIIPYNPHKPYPVKTKGRQCGKCGMKIDHNNMIAFCCGSLDCPMGWGPNR